MQPVPESALDRLWKEYAQVFNDFDDLTLARWLAQTMGQMRGRAWRYSHPLIGCCRLASEIAHSRHLWLKRLATSPAGFVDAPCCRAPMLPLLTRDVMEMGLICQHCGGSAVPLEEIPGDLLPDVKKWAKEYAAIHAVAHWDDRQKQSVLDYNKSLENAAVSAEEALGRLARDLVPRFLDYYPVILWEDQDECLEVRPEDISVR